MRYQDIYPSEPLLKSDALARQSATDLISLEYFEAEPDRMPTQVFQQHHILLNLKEEPHRVENWRDGTYRDFTYHKYEIIVTPAGMESGWRWYAQSKVIVITLEPEKLQRFSEQELGLLLDGEQLRDIPQFIDEDLTNAGVLLLEALRSRNYSSAVMFESLARVFLVKLIERYGRERDADYAFSQSFTARHYEKVLTYVSDHFGHTIRLEDMAEQVGISAFHFARLFKKTIGQSPHQFVISYRVEQAKKLLDQDDSALIDIALRCGFSDQAHFTRAFKKSTGQTPRQWRSIKEQDYSKTPQRDPR